MAKLIFNVPEQVKVSDFEETSLRERYPCFGADCTEVNPKTYIGTLSGELRCKMRRSWKF